MIFKNIGGYKIEIFRYRKYQVSIFKILLAYSAFDSEVGYCQEWIHFRDFATELWFVILDDYSHNRIIHEKGNECNRGLIYDYFQ